jgi:hypothetical protein
MVILALMLIRDFRREDRDDRAARSWEHSEAMLTSLLDAVQPAEATLVGPAALRDQSAAFSREARGDMVWFNVCLSMFEPQPLFDTLLRPALENPATSAVRFILDEGERDRWERAVVPKVQALGLEAKLAEPVWTTLREPVSCILAEVEPSGRREALLSFWGEPFMARTRGRDVPRYIFRIRAHSELITHLSELARAYRMTPN